MASSNQDNRGGGSKQSGNQGGNRQSGDTSNRGFASMDPERQREIASEGGKAAHASGNAHEFTSEEARKAGSMSHKNDGNRQSGSDSGGGSRQSGSGGNSGGSGGGTRGGTPEQHAEAGRQSHKNDDKR
ncbi:Stress-induced acidophilic repeat motif-containing protein [Duganella sp. CF458]|uniref:KGG domain-containing protein n=1 Tax=Duganella sp. CF458 TaxID=1884368 RepID=UPI0008E8ECF3|nr:KGG domain-containing protein [Duganella sp. CF458]SFF91212.1 Stress-induced acidophilic repeat motif-containing protein [Duganella sp. CF458]